MALDSKIIDIALQLYKDDFFKNIDSVIDMGDQDLNISFNDLRKKFSRFNIEIDTTFDRSKILSSRPRLPSSLFWKKIGINQTDRLDLEKLDRNTDEKSHKFIKIDLNYPIEDQTKFEKYDLVTDFGNNEHPFNIVESYKTMHKLCKKKWIYVYTSSNV